MEGSGQPLWCTSGEDDGLDVIVVVIEAFHPLFKRAQDLMEMVAEPKSRTERVHIFHLTEDSLYTATSLGMTSESVTSKLRELSKNGLSDKIRQIIRKYTEQAGKVKLVLQLKDNPDACDDTDANRPAILDILKDDSGIPKPPKSKLTNFIEMHPSIEETVVMDQAVQTEYLVKGSYTKGSLGEDLKYGVFEVRSDAALTDMKKYFKERLRLPLDVVYAHSTDTSTTAVDFRLKPTARLRPYQSVTLTKTLGSGKARSGLIVLPCGAGKTLVGVSITALLGKSAIIVCLNTLTVMQWWNQFRLWTDIRHENISVFTADKKEKPADIVITTYSMLGFPDDRRAAGSIELIASLRQREWGLMLMDEVHVAPADTFRRILDRVKAHCMIGLTATLLREDDKISDLQYLIGPKLYEANWKELCKAGYLADVSCIEVLCPMKGCFLDAYFKETLAKFRSGILAAIMNPSKLYVTQALVRFHRKRGDKILIFSDAVRVVQFYADFLHIPQIVGEVTEKERYSIINHFKHDPTIDCIAMSAAAETGTDVPDANVVIQISGGFGSQRQEAQRLGRILRPKHGGQGNMGWYYSLVSMDTREPSDHSRRRRFLQDQGYAFKVVSANTVLAEAERTGVPVTKFTPEQEQDLLTSLFKTEDEPATKPNKRIKTNKVF
eukprot:TRINITY_DN4246_c5_g1_i1.p1 TRINITY_DN4246_c5_g1~~TRINITY_DN4246_c5_g1_i1.p1  ORF type:complete len:680 (+),score=98.96 TRINITY_DN4246_c5_g1_i1:48-2042(+)